MGDQLGSEIDPDNLYAPVREHGTVKNGFRALSRIGYNWLHMHPTVKREAVTGIAIGASGYLAIKDVEPQRKDAFVEVDTKVLLTPL